jgi:hypothetical protein
MRRSFLVAFSMTLFMLLLVLLAAFYFSYQSQQALQQRLAEAGSERATAVQAATRSAADRDAALETRQAALDALATAEADAVLLEGQLVTSQQQAEELNRQIEALSSNLEATSEAMATRETSQSALSSPLVVISRPASDQPLRAGETVQVIVAASDQSGLANLVITIGDETTTVPVAGGNNLFVYVQPWTPAAEGEYELQVRAANINGQDSQTVTRTVLVQDGVEEGE